MSNKPNDSKNSATCWSRIPPNQSMYECRSPRTLVYLLGNRFSSFYRSSRWSRFEGGRYYTTRNVFWLPATSSQLTMVVLWKRVDSTIHCSSRSRDTNLPPPPPPGSPGHGECCLGTEDFITPAVATVYRLRDLCLHQEHEVVVPFLDGTNIQREDKATSVPKVIRPQVDSHGAGRLVLQYQNFQVEAVTDMPYQSSETYGYISPLTPICLDLLKKIRRTPSCITY